MRWFLNSPLVISAGQGSSSVHASPGITSVIHIYRVENGSLHCNPHSIMFCAHSLIRVAGAFALANPTATNYGSGRTMGGADLRA